MQAEDEMLSQVLALGAIWTLLQSSPYATGSEFTPDIGSDHPSLTVRMPFLRSPYKITVQRITEGEA